MDEFINGSTSALKALSIIGLSIMAAISRTILTEDRRSFIGFVRGLILALFVSIVVANGIDDYGFSETTRASIVGICSFIADDILLGILKIGEMIRKDPFSILKLFHVKQNKE